MDRRRLALAALALFVALTVVATIIGKSRPGLDQGDAPWLFQTAGYLCALLGGVLLLTVAGSDVHRRAGVVVVGALVVLVLLDVLLADDGGGANIGGGLVRLLCLVAIVGATVRVGSAAVSGGRGS